MSKPGTDGPDAAEKVAKPRAKTQDEAADASSEESSKIIQQIQDMEVTFENATKELLQRVQELEKDVGCLIEKTNSGPMAGVGPEGAHGLGDLINKIQVIQADMENMNQTANKLLDDKETRQTHTNVRSRSESFFKVIKALLSISRRF